MAKVFALILGGALGSLLRFGLSGIVQRGLANFNFPYGTLVVNLLGCFLIGVFLVCLDEKFLWGMDLKLLWVVGFCGAFTTFSTFVFDIETLIVAGKSFRALGYILLSVTMGFFLFRLGLVCGRLISA